jgi:hypothetical protein
VTRAYERRGPLAEAESEETGALGILFRMRHDGSEFSKAENRKFWRETVRRKVAVVRALRRNLAAFASLRSANP